MTRKTLYRSALTAALLLPVAAIAAFLILRPDPAATAVTTPLPGTPTVLTEFGDFQCIHCARLALGPIRAIHHDLVLTGNLRFEYRHYPFLGPESLLAAEASECARDQDRFIEYHDAVYQLTLQRTQALDPDNLARAAGQAGLDLPQFEQCAQARTHQDKVQQDKTDGRDLGVRATPTLFLDGAPLRWRDYPDLRSQIQAHVARHNQNNR